jgi:hypothetical protein
MLNDKIEMLDDDGNVTGTFDGTWDLGLCDDEHDEDKGDVVYRQTIAWTSDRGIDYQVCGRHINEDPFARIAKTN